LLCRDAIWTEYLSAEQIKLFGCMSLSEQRHALSVLGTLQRAGHSEVVLGQAALLHDAGKMGGSIRLWHRVLAVLLQSLAPGVYLQIAREEPGSWRYPFFVQLWHASRSADLAAQVGTDPQAVALIRWHHTQPEQTHLDAQGRALLLALRSADDQN
jgi:hypothetical protein